MPCVWIKRLGAICCLALACSGGAARSMADDTAELRRQVETLQQQNAALQRALAQQQTAISELSREVAGMKSTTPESAKVSSTEASSRSWGLSQARVGGQGAVGLFGTGDAGSMPHPQFRVDEAQINVESPIWGDVFFNSEVNLARRYDNELDLYLQELYLDFENISQIWGRDGQLSLRVGRFDIPFGEEYLSREVFDNPLISRSIVDLWGVDEGVELFGALGKFTYAFAVQNGSAVGEADFTDDKSITARLGYDLKPWLHFSVSAMRTGDIDATSDYLSELWVAGGWFRSIGSPSTTKFHANLLQADARIRLPRGHLKGFAGVARYDDNDPLANNRRDIWYYGIEAEHRFTRKFYAAARFSQIFADGGYPLTGYRPIDDFFSGAIMTDQLWRLSLGLGYRFSDNLVVKAEYSFEGGEETNGAAREHENFFGAEAAFKF